MVPGKIIFPRQGGPGYDGDVVPAVTGFPVGFDFMGVGNPGEKTGHQRMINFFRFTAEIMVTKNSQYYLAQHFFKEFERIWGQALEVFVEGNFDVRFLEKIRDAGKLFVTWVSD
jgi:hypothetical protein